MPTSFTSASKISHINTQRGANVSEMQRITSVTVVFCIFATIYIFIQIYPTKFEEKMRFLVYEKQSDGFIRNFITTELSEIRLPGMIINENK